MGSQLRNGPKEGQIMSAVDELARAEKSLQTAKAAAAKLEAQSIELTGKLLEVQDQLETVTDETAATQLHGKQTALSNQQRALRAQLATASAQVEGAQQAYIRAHMARLDADFQAELRGFAVEAMALSDASRRLYALDAQRAAVRAEMLGLALHDGDRVFLRLAESLENLLVKFGLARARVGADLSAQRVMELV